MAESLPGFCKCLYFVLLRINKNTSLEQRSDERAGQYLQVSKSGRRSRRKRRRSSKGRTGACCRSDGGLGWFGRREATLTNFRVLRGPKPSQRRRRRRRSNSCCFVGGMQMPAISPRRLRFCSRLMLTSILIYTYTRAASCQPGLCPWSRPARRGSSVDHQRAFVLACSLKGQQASNPSISILLSCLLLLLFFLLLESQRFFLHPLTCQKNIGGSCSSAFDFLNRHSLLAALKYLLNNSFVFYSLENETVCFFLKDRKFL